MKDCKIYIDGIHVGWAQVEFPNSTLPEKTNSDDQITNNQIWCCSGYISMRTEQFLALKQVFSEQN